MGVFGTGELGDAEAERLGLELGPGFARKGRVIEDLGELESAADARVGLEGDRARVACGGVHLDAVGKAVGQTGSLDRVACVGLLADVDVDFAGGGVIRADDDGLKQVGGAGVQAVV